MKNRSLCERRCMKRKDNNSVDEVKYVCFHFVQASCVTYKFRLIPVFACIRARVLLMLIQMRRLNNFYAGVQMGISQNNKPINWKLEYLITLACSSYLCFFLPSMCIFQISAMSAFSVHLFLYVSFVTFIWARFAVFHCYYCNSFVMRHNNDLTSHY